MNKGKVGGMRRKANRGMEVGTAFQAVRSQEDTRSSVGLTAVGRDGSPSRPFADEDTKLDRLNGGFGEPALPKTLVEGDTA
jgi:hypothetical protein